MIAWQVEQVYLHRHPVDFRKSINGLAMIVEQQCAAIPFDGSVFAFCNKGRDKLKVLYWDKTGFALWYKRLEKDTFKWPAKERKTLVQLTAEQWQWLLSGLSVIAHQPLQYTSSGL